MPRSWDAIHGASGPSRHDTKSHDKGPVLSLVSLHERVHKAQEDDSTGYKNMICICIYSIWYMIDIDVRMVMRFGCQRREILVP